jgi:hypothetical protein
MTMKNFNLRAGSVRILRNSLAGALAVAAVAITPNVFADESIGMQVVRDDETGALRAPNAVEAKAMQAAREAMRQNGKSKKVGIISGKESPAPQLLPAGGIAIELTEDTMAFSVVHRDADGKLDMQCIIGTDKIEKTNNKSAKATAHKHTHAHPHKEHSYDVQ